VKEYDGKVRVVYKNMVVHPQVVTKAHLAGCAAGKQGKFVEFKNAWWEQAFAKRQFDDDVINKIAKDIGLDMTKFKADWDGEDCKKLLADDANELAKFHVNSTPTFFINGQHVGGALPKEEFKKIIDDKLKIAEASGVTGAEYYDKEIMGKGEKQFRSKKDPKPAGK
jgi:Predicted dithiol-disulfide isomerase involved in polyketide biosynthesis